MGWVRSTHGGTINTYILFGELEGKRQFRKSGRIWVNNIKMNIK